LGAISFAPARAETADDTQAAAQLASLPEIPVPDLLDADGEPRLSDPTVEGTIPAPVEEPEAEPAKPVAADLASLVAEYRGSDPGSRELECLAVGVYFESKSEPLSGQLAVGHVIANRANSGGRFPSSYCGVLYQRGQFSFVRGRSVPYVPRASKQWQTAVAIAKIVDRELKPSLVGNAMFFHARYVSPQWRLKRVASIGNHIFYR
jgi:spore germination cell wall hydrolase CwlJ-like protein